MKLPYHRNLTMLIDLRVSRTFYVYRELTQNFAKVRFTYMHQVDVH